MSSGIICVLHGRELKIAENGVICEQLDDNGDPYKVFYSDKWNCPECSFEVLVIAPNPVAEHFQPGYIEGPYRERVTVTWQA